MRGSRTGLLAVLLVSLAIGSSPARVRAQGLFGFDFDPLTRVPNALVGKRAPELLGDTGWLNSAAPLRLADLAGRIVLLDFFDYACVNCIRTFPYLREWDRRYRSLGLTVIGIHTPEFAFGRDEQNVGHALVAHGITYPVVLDSNLLIWREYHNRYWPREFLLDTQGIVRLDHRGEGGYAEMESKIQELLRARDPGIELPRPMSAVRDTDRVGAVCFPTTPETYVGHLRGKLGNPEGYKPNSVVVYQDPGGATDGTIYAQGAWENRGQYLQHAREAAGGEDYLRLQYHAVELHAVLESIEGPAIDVLVWQNGKALTRAEAGDDVAFDDQGRSLIKVREPRMYSVVKGVTLVHRQIVLSSAAPSLGVYAFTFGSCVDPSGKSAGKGTRARRTRPPRPTVLGLGCASMRGRHGSRVARGAATGDWATRQEPSRAGSAAPTAATAGGAGSERLAGG